MFSKKLRNSHKSLPNWFDMESLLFFQPKTCFMVSKCFFFVRNVQFTLESLLWVQLKTCFFSVEDVLCDRRGCCAGSWGCGRRLRSRASRRSAAPATRRTGRRWSSRPISTRAPIATAPAGHHQATAATSFLQITSKISRISSSLSVSVDDNNRQDTRGLHNSGHRVGCGWKSWIVLDEMVVGIV